MVTKTANIFLKNSLSTPITKEAPNPAPKSIPKLNCRNLSTERDFFDNESKQLMLKLQ